MKKYFILFLLIYNAIIINAQYSTDKKVVATDSLRNNLMGSGKFAEAIPLNEQLLKAAEKTGRDSFILNELNNTAFCFRQNGQADKAIISLKRAATIAEKMAGTQSYEYGNVLGNLANCYKAYGDYDEALNLLLRAKEILKATVGTQNSEYANSLNNLASLYRQMGNLPEAEALLIQAKDLKLEILGKEHPDYATAQNNLAMLYVSMNRLPEAEPLFISAESIRKQKLGEAHPMYGQVLNNLGLLYSRMKRYEEAKKIYAKASAITKEKLGETHPDFAFCLRNTAQLYAATKRFSEAQQLYLQALAIQEKTLGSEHSSYILTLIDISNLFINAEELDSAYSYCFKSILSNSRGATAEKLKSFEQFETINFHSNTNILNSLSVLQIIFEQQYSKTGNKSFLKNKYLAAKATMQLRERFRNEFGSEMHKLRVLSSNTETLINGISAALSLQNPSYIAEAFSFAEQNKSILLNDIIKVEKAHRLGDLPDTLVQQEDALLDKLERLKKKQNEAQSPADKAQALAALNECNNEVLIFLKSIKNKYPKYHKLKYENISANAAEIQKLLTHKQALLEYFMADSVLYLFVLTKKDLTLLPIAIDQKTFREDLRMLRKCLTEYKEIRDNAEKAYLEYTEVAYRFQQRYVKAGLDRLRNITELIIIPDDLLGHIPFEALLLKPAKKEIDYNQLDYLLKKYQVSYNYSATLWKENRQHLSKQQNGKMLAFAADYKTAAETNVSRSARNSNIRNALAPLPAAEKEVEVLGSLFKGRFLLKADANEKAFKELAGDYSIIHLAMHGILNKQKPLLSSLAFTENGDSTEDNFLEAWEISQMKLNAQLVVLSACETGYGKFQQGEGVMSLARSFMYAGLPSLVVSLWQVNDASTSAIMQLFYKNLAKGMNKAAALRQAKLEYMKVVNNPNAAHPAFWAAFVLIGDERPIVIATKGSGMMWYLIGGVGLLALIGSIFVLRRKEK